MDNGNILAVDGGRVLGSQLCHHLLQHLHGELGGSVQIRAGGHGGLYAADNLGAVGHVGAGLKHVADHGVQGSAGLTAQELGRLQNGVVQGGQLQHVGLGDEVAVLGHGRGDGAHVQGLAVRGNALSQRSQRLGKGRELTELNGLAAVCGDGTLLTELVMYQLGLSLVNEGHVVEGLHFGRQVVAGGRVRGHVDMGCEKLQVDEVNGIHFLISFFNDLVEGD